MIYIVRYVLIEMAAFARRREKEFFTMRKVSPWRRAFSIALVIAMLCSLMMPSAFAETLSFGRNALERSEEASSRETEPVDFEPLDYALTDIVRVSIELEDPGTLDAGYDMDRIAKNGSARSYRDSLLANQRSVTAQIRAAISGELDVKWHITLAANIISAEARYGDLDAIRGVPGVKRVFLENHYDAPVVEKNEAADPHTANSSAYMVGAAESWAEGYTGAGSRVAIIDTGLDTTHQSMDADAFNYAISQTGKSVSLFTQSDLSTVLTQLNAYSEQSTKPTAAQLYHSAKIPYGFNYIDSAYYYQIDHLNDTQGEHGSHVAGIAAANRYVKSGSSYVDAASTVHAVGMAPDAQLFIMKVFGAAGGAYDSDYMVAIEDAIILGCDVVNLSLGSASPGFVYSDAYQSIMNKLANASSNTKLVVSISAGNAGAFTDQLTTDLYIEDVNMHTGGNPGSFTNSLCVASANNVGVTGMPMVFNGSQRVFYTETDSTGAKLNTIAGSYSYVYIDAVGNADDYSAVNSAASLSGKVVIVNRGSISFVDKGNNLKSYNPKALVVANNDSGTVNMALDDYTGTFPMVAITQTDANTIKANSTAHTAGSITYYTGTVQVTATMISEKETDNAEMSSFSSWGVPGALIMKPEITAPGGNIYSLFGTNKTSSGTSGGSDQYELMSGTSMAAPHVAGLTGTLAQYMRENNISVSGHTTRQLVQSLLMSTAVPMHEGSASGPYYPILRQGAGLVNVHQAIHASSVIFMGSDATRSWADGKVKAELGDKPTRSGDYTYSFEIHNLASQAQTYNLSTDLFTQDRYEEDGHAFMSPSTTALNWNVSYSTGNTVNVPAGGSQTVAVTISIPDDTAAFDALYPNGAYVEGYTFVESTATSGDGAKLDVPHSIPVLGFYGSWTDPSMFDNMSYVDGLYGADRTPYSGKSDTNYMTYQTHGSTKKVQGNPYILETPFPADRLAMNSADYVSSFTYNLVRSAGATGFAVSKLDTRGQVSSVLQSNVTGANVLGMWYYSSGSAWQNTATSTYTLNQTVSSLGLTAGDRFRIGFYAIPEYNAMQVNTDLTAAGAGQLTNGTFKNLLLKNTLGKGAMVGYDFIVDDQAPQIIGAYRQGNEVTVTVRDDHYIACLGLSNATGKTFYQQIVPQQTEEGQAVVYTFDVSGVTDGFYVFAGDYACNETLVQPTTLEHTVTAVSSDESLGTVSVSGYTVLAQPAEGYYVSGAEVISGTATYEINGSVISVNPATDCTIRILFSPKPVVTVRYVANGVQEETVTCYLQDVITLKESIVNTAAGYTFSGWVSSTFGETTDTPPYYAPGAAYTVPGNVTLYALYTRHEGAEGVTYELCTALPEDLIGNYVITSAADTSGYMMLNYNGGYNYNYDAAVLISASGATLSGTTLTNVQSDAVFTVQASTADPGKYNILPYTINGIYLADKSTGLGVNTYDNDSTQWSFSCTDGRFYISSDSYDYMNIALITSYFSSSVYFSTQRTNSSTGVNLWREQPAGLDYFTTNPLTDDHEHEMTLVPAVEPTCGAEGHSAYYHCELCGKYFSDASGENEITPASTVIPATGDHTFGACTSNNDGTHNHTCAVCGTVETEPCTYEDTVIEPTETAQGYTLHTCVSCGYSFKDSYTAPIGQTLTVTFLVPTGVASVEPMTCQTGESIALPAAQAPDGYTFLGWVVDVYDNVEEKPSEIFKGSYTPAENVTLRALYTYSVGGSGGVAFELVTEAPDDWTGRYVVTHKKETSNTYYVLTGLNAGINYESSAGQGGATKFTETGIVQDGTTLAEVSELYIFEVEAQGSVYSFKNASTGSYLDYISSSLYSSASYSTTAKWNPSINASGNAVLNNPNGGTSWNTVGLNGSGRFAMVLSTDSSVSNMYIWRETPAGTPYYTTVIGETHEHTPGQAVKENEVAATCTEDGSYDSVVYCTVCGEEISRETVTIPATGHDWGTPNYEWAEDNSTVTATRVCANDASHVETEAVTTTYTVLQEPTTTEEGKGQYTAVFDNEAFEIQIREVVLPKLEITGYHIIVNDYTNSNASTSIEAETLYSGEVTFTVSCGSPCLVAIDKGNDVYEMLACTTNGDTHSFTVTVTNADVTVIVAIKGDADLNGERQSKDATFAAQAIAGKRTFTTLQQLVCDSDGNGVFNSKDATFAAQVVAGKRSYEW